MRERRNYLILMGFIVAAVIGAMLLAVPGSPAYKKPTLGLDLQGGLEVILKAVPNRGQTINPAQMQTAQDIIATRVNGIGVTVAERRAPGHRRDRHPARRNPQSGEGGGAHRLDRRAAVLRLRGRSPPADDLGRLP